MNSSNSSTFSCRFCQHYEVEGRRGGNCQMMNVPVQGNWKACSFAIRYFAKEKLTLKEMNDSSNVSVSSENIWLLKKYKLAKNSAITKVS